MNIYLLRHGTRNFTLGDVPLNEEGLEQAEDLAKRGTWADLHSILSSPKKRAKMTIEPTAERHGHPIQVLEELDQMRGGEGEAEFKARVKNLIHRIESGEFGEKVMVCTHSDWLAMAVQVIPTDALDLEYKMFQCAEVLEFKLEQGLWKLKD